MKLLIIDSDPLTLKSFADMLAHVEGLTIIGLVGNVVEALDICKQVESEGMLMTICTNNINGIKLIRAYYPKIKILLLVNFAICENTAEYVCRLGADGYVEKADDVARILGQLKQIWSKSG